MEEQQIIRKIKLDNKLEILDNLSNNNVTNSYIIVRYECLDNYYKERENTFDYIYGELLTGEKQYFTNSRVEVVLFMKDKVSAEIKYEFERDELFVKKYFIDEIDINNIEILIEAIKDNIPSLGKIDKILEDKREDNTILKKLKEEIFSNEKYPYLSNIMTKDLKILQGDNNED